MPWGCLSRTRDLGAIVLAALVLVACPEDGEPEARPDPSPTVELRSGGTVRVGVYGEPATLDPYSKFASDLTYALVRPLYRSLFRMQPDGTASPDLAASIDVLPGGARIVLVEASWADGTPITAGDVAASIRRARKPSGFSQVTAARVIDARTIELRGSVADWPLTLAQGAFVLPGGGSGAVAGPWTISKRVPGLKIVYEPTAASTESPSLDRIVVLFVESDATLRSLLESGEIDVAALPATTNLLDRLEETGLHHSAARGSEMIVLDLTRSDLSRGDRRRLISTLPLRAVKSRLVRDLGTLRRSPRPAGALSASSVRITVPEGDELLAFIQRAAYEELTARGFDVELASVDAVSIYARSTDGIVVKRTSGPADNVLTKSIVPLFEMDSVVAFTDRVTGVTVNPWSEGVLWNAESWSLSSE